MQHKSIELKQARVQQLFDDAKREVISQIIGPFGLSSAMFEDRNGGNVTTVHNFSRDDDSYVTEKDKGSYEQSRKGYSREDYEDPKFAEKSKQMRSVGKDGYTGKNVDPTSMDLDHVTSCKEISQSKKIHLAMETGDGYEQVKEIVNNDNNLVTTDKSINRSKGSDNLKEFSEGRGQKYNLDPESVQQAEIRSKDYINDATNNALLKKYSTELLETGGKQAAQMGIKQALGMLLTELVNGLFNEFKILIKEGAALGKSILDEIKQRLANVIRSVAKKIPAAIQQMFQGGVSGFLSNLLTFLLNNFISTAKRFVTVIREGLLGLFRAFKIIFFPPKHLTASQAIQEGLKILATVVTTSLGFILTESVNSFLGAIPGIGQFAGILSSVLVGILTGLISVFLIYKIDCLFDRLGINERFLDEIISGAKKIDLYANELVKLTESSLINIENYAKSIALYQEIGVSFANANLAANSTLNSLILMNSDLNNQISENYDKIDYINKTQSEIEDFLSSI